MGVRCLWSIVAPTKKTIPLDHLESAPNATSRLSSSVPGKAQSKAQSLLPLLS